MDDNLDMAPPSTPFRSETPLMRPQTPLHQLQTPMMSPGPLLPPHTPLMQPDTPLMRPQTPLMPQTPGIPGTPLHEYPPDTPSMNESHLDMQPPSVMAPPMTPLHFAPQTPAPQTPLPMEVDLPAMMPHLQADQVNSILAENGSEHPPSTPSDGLLHNVLGIPQTPYHQIQDNPHNQQIEADLNAQLPDLANMGYVDHQPVSSGHMQMENMGYDDDHHHGADLHIDTDHGEGGHDNGAHNAGSPWHDNFDYGSPSAVVDEQLQDETDEQFEERVLNKRAAQLFISVKNKLLKSDELHFMEMVHKNTRKQVCYYTQEQKI